MKTEKHLYDKRILATRLHLLIQSYTPFNGNFSGKPACVSQFPLISSLQWSLSWAASQVRSGHISVHPFHELIQSRRFCRLSVCLCVCPSVNFFCPKSLLLRQKWLDRDQTCTGWSAGEWGMLKVKVKVLAQKLLLLPGKWPDCDQTCTQWSPGQRASRLCSRSRSKSKVMWYG